MDLRLSVVQLSRDPDVTGPTTLGPRSTTWYLFNETTQCLKDKHYL